jgi:hypothetical protein
LRTSVSLSQKPPRAAKRGVFPVWSLAIWIFAIATKIHLVVLSRRKVDFLCSRSYLENAAALLIFSSLDQIAFSQMSSSSPDELVRTIELRGNFLSKHTFSFVVKSFQDSQFCVG